MTVILTTHFTLSVCDSQATFSFLQVNSKYVEAYSGKQTILTICYQYLTVRRNWQYSCGNGNGLAIGDNADTDNRISL
jgi:hypothetical protein